MFEHRCRVKKVEGRNETRPKHHMGEFQDIDKWCKVMNRLRASIDVPLYLSSVRQLNYM